jgi:hypothetical protein
MGFLHKWLGWAEFTVKSGGPYFPEPVEVRLMLFICILLYDIQAFQSDHREKLNDINSMSKAALMLMLHMEENAPQIIMLSVILTPLLTCGR